MPDGTRARRRRRPPGDDNCSTGSADERGASAADPRDGETLLDVAVDERGAASAITPLLETPGLTESIRRSVAGWRFSPATEADKPVASHVLVAAVFRPPALFMPGAGEAEAAAPPSTTVPYPTTIVPPAYPPNAVGDGVVIVEMEVGTDGAVSRASVVRSSPPFDGPATEAALRWRFQPATTGPTLAYAIFGFRQPVF